MENYLALKYQVSPCDQFIQNNFPVIILQFLFPCYLAFLFNTELLEKLARAVSSQTLFLVHVGYIQVDLNCTSINARASAFLLQFFTSKGQTYVTLFLFQACRQPFCAQFPYVFLRNSFLPSHVPVSFPEILFHS